MITIEPSGIFGTVHPEAADDHSTGTICNSIKKENPIIDTNAMIIFSILGYEFVFSRTAQNTAVKILPIVIGILNSKFRAIAPPKISARAVAIEAIIAEASTGREIHCGRNYVAASDKQRPVTIPRCAALC